MVCQEWWVLCGCHKEFEGMMEETAQSLDFLTRARVWGGLGKLKAVKLKGCWGIDSLGWGRVGRWNPKEMTNPIKYPVQIHLDKSLLKEVPMSSDESYLFMPPCLEKESLLLFLIGQKREKTLSPFLSKGDDINPYRDEPSFTPSNLTSPRHLPHCCQSHLPKAPLFFFIYFY